MGRLSHTKYCLGKFYAVISICKIDEAISQLRCPLLRYVGLVSIGQNPTPTTCEIVLTDAQWGLSQSDHRARQLLERDWTMVVVVGRISLLFTLVVVSSGVILFLAASNMV